MWETNLYNIFFKLFCMKYFMHSPSSSYPYASDVILSTKIVFEYIDLIHYRQVIT